MSRRNKSFFGVESAQFGEVPVPAGAPTPPLLQVGRVTPAEKLNLFIATVAFIGYLALKKFYGPKRK